MLYHRMMTNLGWLALSMFVQGCMTGPPPIVIYEDAQESVWLKFDPEAGTGHDHPASVTPEQMALVLRGIRVMHRDAFVGFGAFTDQSSAPAFSGREVTLLAPYLSQALTKASPKDMATFYMITFLPDRGKLVTSGGLFVRNSRLYVFLANTHTSPSSLQYENTISIDTRDQPLLPIERLKFIVGFNPKEAWIPNERVRGKDGYERYLDESKLVVIDLPRLLAETPSSPSPSPPGQPASPPRP